MDVCGVTPARGGLGIGLLCVREGRLMDGRTFFWPGLELADAEECLRTFLPQYYGPPGTVPPRVVVPWLPTSNEEEGADEDAPAPPDAEALHALEAALADARGGPVRIAVRSEERRVGKECAA